MSNLGGAYVRRQELVATEAEVAANASKVLLDGEMLYVKMNNGTLRAKMGDGQTAVGNLPYTQVFDGDMEIINAELAKRYEARGFLENGFDLNTLKENCSAMIASSRTYMNCPISEGAIYVNAGSVYVTQTAVDLVYGKTKYRRYDNSTSTWGVWRDVDLDTFIPNIEGQDMTNEILFRLMSAGTVILGTGEYIVNGLTMPDNTTIIGQGNKTILKVTTNGASAIYMRQRCTVKDLKIVGTGSDEVIQTNGSGVGIGIMPTDGAHVYNCKIDNCQISNFALAGIHVVGTGYWCADSLTVSNCEIYNCHRGISIGIHSEYSRYTNILTRDCYFGCYNMGGNNVFVNCTFSNSAIGAYLPCHLDGVINNGHGSFIGCTFNHNGNNEGHAVIINKVTNGFVFSGCQFWYGKMLIENCEGIVFNGCQFGGTLEIVTWSNTLCMFANSVFATSPNLSGTANARKFVNCYLDTGEAITE